jgi:hypothetical protein
MGEPCSGRFGPSPKVASPWSHDPHGWEDDAPGCALQSVFGAAGPGEEVRVGTPPAPRWQRRWLSASYGLNSFGNCAMMPLLNMSAIASAWRCTAS